VGTELIAINQRRTSVVIAARDGKSVNASSLEVARSKSGWVMVPGLNYRRKIAAVVSDQFSILEKSIVEKKTVLHEHLLSLLERIELWIIEDLQEAAKSWAIAESRGGDIVITRDVAEKEALRIVSLQFDLLTKHASTPEYRFIDMENPKEAVIVHEITILELSVKRYVSKLIQGWA
jgi:hypothetical protein